MSPRLPAACITFFSCVILCLAANAQTATRPLSGAELHFSGDPAYDSAVLGSIRAGLAPESNAWPLFGGELDSGLDASASSPFLGAAWRFSSPTLFYDSPALPTDIAPNLTSNPTLTPRRFPEILHYLSGVPDPLGLEVRLDPSTSTSFRIDLHLGYRRDRITGNTSTLRWSMNDWLLNLLGAIEFPRKAWVSWYSDGFGAALGRFPSGMGSGTLTGVLMNPRASWYDQARLQMHRENLRFTWILATSSAQLSAAESEIQFRRVSGGGSFWDALNDHDFAGSDVALKLATWHQVEWKPAPWISIGFAELGMIGGRVPALNFVLPSVVWHNTYAAGNANVAASLNAAVVPLPGLHLSGEFLVDDVRSYDEPAYAKPNSFAWNGSARFTGLSGNDSSYDLGAEYAHVDRWTYVRWQPYLAMYQRQTLTGGDYSLDQSLGAPWGPDNDSVALFARFARKDGAKAELRYEYVRKGPIHQGMAKRITLNGTEFTGAVAGTTMWVPVYYDYDKYAGTGALAAILARPDEHRHIVTLSGSVPVLAGTSLKLETTYAHYLNFANTAGTAKDMWLVYAGVVLKLPANTH